MFAFYWTSAILWAVITAVVSVIPSSSVSIPPLPYADKALHVLCYSILSFLLAQAFTATWTAHPVVTKVGGALVVAALYGLLLELIQGLLPVREASLGDAAANFAGACCGSCGYLIRARKE